MRTLKLTDFREDLTRTLRDIDATGEPVVITNYGRPYAVVIPVPEHLRHDPQGVAAATVADLPDTL